MTDFRFCQRELDVVEAFRLAELASKNTITAPAWVFELIVEQRLKVNSSRYSLDGSDMLIAYDPWVVCHGDEIWLMAADKFNRIYERFDNALAGMARTYAEQQDPDANSMSTQLRLNPYPDGR